VTDYARRKIVTTRIEYGVEAGARIADLMKIVNMARTEYCQLTGTDPNNVPDDWATVRPSDDEIVIGFAVDKETRET